LDCNFRWVKAKLYVAYCARCHAEYYPDRVTYHRDETSRGRIQKLEYEGAYLRVSKHGIWMDRRIAHAQENAILRFHSGWANFAEWLSDTIGAKSRITTRQSQRLYFEHFVRRLTMAHGLEDTFTIPAHSSAQIVADAVQDAVGKDGGVVAGSMDHGCTNCTHLKRYTADLLAEGAVLDVNLNGVVDAPQLKLYSWAVAAVYWLHCVGVMLLCLVFSWFGGGHWFKSPSWHLFPLKRYEHYADCLIKLHMVTADGAVTCDDDSHKDWHQKYLNRFSRLSFPGVQRVIRRQAGRNDANVPLTGPTLHSELPELNGTAGDSVAHTFRARSTYCLQTVQWSCGCPIGWGKCYRSESSSQVLKIIDNIWEDHPESRPGFLAYDDACNLLLHLVTQNPNSSWIQTTKFIVDAWHYIGHRDSDVLCRAWCNPAPTDGSQPDLISVSIDDNGRTHTTRAFNTETAEQLNAWLNGYEAQLRQMSAVNYDFAIHVLMLLSS
ncbi:hypothetical protein B0H13DRAFT_1465837, partial [Mycena leptocephala]